MRTKKKQHGVSVIEYMILLMIIMGGLIWMQQYIQRAFQGHWKSAGDAFGMQRQYQPGHTIDCAFAQINSDYGVWYDDTCYQQLAASTCKPADTICENAIRMVTCKQDYCCEDTNCNQ